jgi:predicted transcriptional regulator
MSNVAASKNQLSSQEQDQVERFESAYNAIDRHLRKVLNQANNARFTQLIGEYSRRGKLGNADHNDLRTFADLRNVLVHEKVKPRTYLAMPAPFVVEKIESIRDRILHPELLIPKFQKTVESIKIDDALARVLALIAERDYSQFPVYDGEHFKGLLTENGITRWLAHHVSKVLSLVDLEDVSTKHVLGEEEKRRNVEFVSRSLTMYELMALFAETELLEAALITQNGKPSEKLMGIVTRWDVVQLKNQHK